MRVYLVVERFHLDLESNLESDSMSFVQFTNNGYYPGSAYYYAVQLDMRPSVIL